MSLQRSGVVLGVVALAAAVATGSRVLGVVGVGFLVAGGITWLWAWLVDGGVRVSHAHVPASVTEGDRVRLRLDVQRSSRMPVGSIAVRVGVGELGEMRCPLKARGRTTTGQIDLGRLPRGVYPLTDTSVELGDLLGLLSVRPQVVAERASIVVRPRLADLDGLFSDAGSTAGDGRRVLLRRSAGFDFHSVREYEQGESLRRVHWPTSARRGQLMVKELEDTASDGVVVVLDCDPRTQAGDAFDSSFDAAVRAAGSLVQAHSSRGRVAFLASTGQGRAVVPVRSAADLEGLLTSLAAARADARDGLARFLAGEHPWSSNGELVVVTSTDDPGAFGQLVALSTRRRVSVAWVDAPSFVGRPTRAEPGLLRLAAHGVATAVVRRGDDLAAVLSARALQAVARG
jgi:uncharacterized protein (DUF58 family)